MNIRSYHPNSSRGCSDAAQDQAVGEEGQDRGDRAAKKGMPVMLEVVKHKV